MPAPGKATPASFSGSFQINITTTCINKSQNWLDMKHLQQQRTSPNFSCTRSLNFSKFKAHSLKDRKNQHLISSTDLPKSPEYAPGLLLQSWLQQQGFEIPELAKLHLYLCHAFVSREGGIRARSKEEQSYSPVTNEGLIAAGCREQQLQVIWERGAVPAAARGLQEQITPQLVCVANSTSEKPEVKENACGNK